jgi:beta-glucosidase
MPGDVCNTENDMKRCQSEGSIGAVLLSAMLVGCGSNELQEPIATTQEAVFLESGGQVVMEAEHFTANVAQGSDSWQPSTTGSPSGGQALAALPDNDTNNNTGYVTASPRLDFAVNFAQTGTYRVWVRGRDSGTTTGSGDSVHAGLDGAAIASADRIASFTSSFGWSKSTIDNVEATVNVTTPGTHTVNIWMREDGFVIDKLLLTTSSTFTPTGTGPAESGQQGGCSPTTYEAETMFHSTGGSTTGGWNIWSDGFISTNHTFTAGPTTLTVTAQGTFAGGAWPHMVVRVGSVNGTGGTMVGEATVSSSSWTDYPFFFTATGGTQEVSVTFDNDFNMGGEDRNLLVDKVVVVCGGTAPTCTDTVKNGNETDVDCGGPTCPDCPNGKTCLVNGDCVSGNCNVGVCAPPGSIPPYKDPSLPIATRVADLLSRMTLDEKIGQMTQGEQNTTSTGQTTSLFLGSVLSGADSFPGGHTAAEWISLVNGHQQAALATRLGIPIIYGIDAVHGQAKVQGGTVFPHNIGIGATRNAALAQEMGVITAREMLLSGIPWTFAPALSVTRDPRWGRAYESFGEDPALASLLSSNITGLQGTNLANNVLATAKHYVGDGGAAWGTGSNPGGTMIDRGNVTMTLNELRAIHLAPYLPAINTHHVGSIMASFSSFNGTRMHAEQNLITNVLKGEGELAFSGFVISDWQAIDQLPGSFNDKVRVSVNAGVDMFMMPDSFQNFISTLRTEVNNILPGRIDNAVSRILTKKFELGLFEVPFVNQRASGTIGAASHRATARQAVRESLVLLKNSGGILPLSTSTSVCVNGSGADNLTAQMGAWTLGWQSPRATMTGATTILTGIDAIANVVASGCQVGIRVIAESPQSYAEWFGDNANPSHDNSGSCVGSQGCVVVLLGGRPMNIQSLVNDANTRAIVMAWYPGSEGAGVADVLFGQGGANFTGKLPVTWKVDSVETPVFYCDSAIPNSCAGPGEDYSNTASPPASVLFPYGFGLTYGTGPTCTDGTKNGAETDVDCGGGTCPDCVDGRICSVNGDCTGNNCVSGTCCSVLSAPTGLSAMPGNAQVSLSWNAASGAESYNVKRATVAGGPYSTVGTSATPSFVNGSLTNGTTYFFVTSAVNTCGAVSTESANSSSVSATPTTCTDGVRNGTETDIDCGGGTCPDCVDGRLCSVSGDCTGNNCVSGTCCSVLAAPTGLSAMPGNAQVSLSWNAVSGAESYNIKRGTTAGGATTTVGTSATPSFVNSMLTNGTTYFFATSAVNTCGAVSTQSANSSEVSATPSAGGSCTPTTVNCEFQMSGSVASVEGEHYFQIVTTGVTTGDTWNPFAAGAASGGQAMQVGPDNGSFWTTIGTIQTTSPMLQFKVNFSAGTFFLHLRGDASNGSNDSCWGGIDGVLRASNASPTIYDFPETAGSWAWRSVSLGTVAVGIHDINVWAREDGFILDKLVITTSSTAPTGAGPAESVLN